MRLAYDSVLGALNVVFFAVQGGFLSAVAAVGFTASAVVDVKRLRREDGAVRPHEDWQHFALCTGAWLVCIVGVLAG